VSVKLFVSPFVDYFSLLSFFLGFAFPFLSICFASCHYVVVCYSITTWFNFLVTFGFERKTIEEVFSIGFCD